jgi:hypothetical protein
VTRGRLRPGQTTKLCPAALHERALTTTVPCMQCAAINALDELAATLIMVLPGAAGVDQLGEVLAGVAWTGAQRRSLTRLLRAEPEALRAGAWPAPPTLDRLVRRLAACGVKGVIIPQPPRRLCPAGRHDRSGWRRGGPPCFACAAEAALDEAVRVLGELVPTLPSSQVRAVIAGAARNHPARLVLVRHLKANPDALSSGMSDVPPPMVHLVNALADAGVDGVTRLRCVACRRPNARLDTVGTGGRLCPNCGAHRRPTEACERCGQRRHVACRTPEGTAMCGTCSANDVARWEPCSRCGTTSQVIRRVEGQPVGRCCYVTPVIRCTMCGITKGERPWRTRRPVCAGCATDPSVPCSVCGRSATSPAAGETAVCAMCRTSPARACHQCGRPTPGRDRTGRPRCFDCYRRPVRACGRCGRVRAIVRLATSTDPDLCAICWTGPTVTCESCGEVRPCRGERRGRMLCSKCGPVAPQRCAHCGRLQRVCAQWVEGPVCASCYHRALRAKATCPGCGQWRRLRTWKDIAKQMCSDCAGAEPYSVCAECGTEDYLYERGRCPACTLRRRLDRILGDPSERASNGLSPLHDTLVRLTSPRDVIRWLQLSAVPRLLHEIATGVMPLSFTALDELPRSRAVWFVEHLLTTSGVLPGRDPVLARLELWVTAWLDTLDVGDHERVLRRYATWQILRPLREASRRRWLSDTRLNSAKGRLSASRDLVEFVHQQGRRLHECLQSDLDRWCATRPPSRVRAAGAFWRWATRHNLGALELTYPSATDDPRTAVPAGAAQWQLAQRLLHADGIHPRYRVAGLLVILYAQPACRVARLTHADVVVTSTTVAVKLGRSPIKVPEPLATHIRQLLPARPATTAGKTLGGTAWLFPGNHPGRPVHATALSRQLARLGVRVSVTRVAALAHLATVMPVAVVADLVGIHRNTAAIWAKSTGGTWADYTVQRNSQPPRRLV